MKRPVFSRRRDSFTLIETLVTLAIVALLATLFMPNLQLAMVKARSVKCGANLRSIGIAATLAAADNHNRVLEIDQAGDQSAPIYTDGKATNMVGALGPYGISTDTLKCPTDISGGAVSFNKYGSSYEWNPCFDDEVVGEPVIYFTPTRAWKINNSRVRLATDFTGVHAGRVNGVYGDGHVSIH